MSNIRFFKSLSPLPSTALCAAADRVALTNAAVASKCAPSKRDRRTAVRP